MRSSNQYCFIYLIKNLIDQKSYVGFHTTNDIYDNYNGSGIFIGRAIKKYGRDTFIKGVLEFCSIEEWKEKESFWIKELNTKHPYGYNLTDGGEGGIGKIVSEESKKRMSKTRRERKLAEGKNNGMYGCNHTEKARKNMSITRKQNKCAVGKNNGMFEKGFLVTGEKNGRFDHTIYKLKNLETDQIFEDYRSNLIKFKHIPIYSLRCLIKKKQYKQWIII